MHSEASWDVLPSKRHPDCLRVNIFAVSSLELGAHSHLGEHEGPRREGRLNRTGRLKCLADTQSKANPRDLGFGRSTLAGAFVVGFLTGLRLSLTVGHNSMFKYPMSSLGILASGDCLGLYRKLLPHRGLVIGYMQFLLFQFFWGG